MPHAIPRPWTPADLKKMRTLAKKGLSSREAALQLRRTPGAVRFAAMTHRVRFHAVQQPVGPQKCLAARRRKFGMQATLSRKAA